jgi:hypothetical protein
MLTERQRKQIARNFINEFFSHGRSFELWRNYDSQVNNEARAFMPYPRMFVTSSNTPYIGVAETKEEAFEIMEKETPKDRIELGLPEIEQYGKYWVVYD